MAIAPDVIEQWKEINANARQWETLVFESAKGYFNVVALSVGGAGSAIAWTGVSDRAQRLAVLCFLTASILLASFALVALGSQQAFLGRLYTRRRQLEKENQGLRLRDDNVNKSGRTLIASGVAFGLLSFYPLRSWHSFRLGADHHCSKVRVFKVPISVAPDSLRRMLKAPAGMPRRDYLLGSRCGRVSDRETTRTVPSGRLEVAEPSL
jgi:hypothetical protein